MPSVAGVGWPTAPPLLRCHWSDLKPTQAFASSWEKRHSKGRRKQMIREILKGTVAGAVGTVALNVATYADMAIRGRPSSSAPAHMVRTLARLVGLAPATQDADTQDQAAQNRQSRLGALLGQVSGR